jgi:HTH-type transcriptional regulator/antitoxin HigA
MNIRPIHTEEDYRAALEDVSALFENEPEPGTPEGDYFDIMITLIEAYEARHFPLDLPNPIDAIRFGWSSPGCRQPISLPQLAGQIAFMRF